MVLYFSVTTRMKATKCMTHFTWTSANVVQGIVDAFCKTLTLYQRRPKLTVWAVRKSNEQDHENHLWTRKRQQNIQSVKSKLKHILYLPTFSESNVWDFRLVTIGIFDNETATSEDFPKTSERCRKCPKMLRRNGFQSLKSKCKLRREKFSALR